jgi:hypothetical protein
MSAPTGKPADGRLPPDGEDHGHRVRGAPGRHVNVHPRGRP